VTEFQRADLVDAEVSGAPLGAVPGGAGGRAVGDADLFDDDLDGVAVGLDAAIKSAADPLRTKSTQ
jgi:hypothetical protein